MKIPIKNLQARIPVIVGADEVCERGRDPLDSSEPLSLMHQALLSAEQDSSVRMLHDIDSLDIVAELSWPYADACGLLSARLGIKPRRAVYGEIGGESPVRFIHEAALRIARGRRGRCLSGLCGGIRIEESYEPAVDAERSAGKAFERARSGASAGVSSGRCDAGAGLSALRKCRAGALGPNPTAGPPKPDSFIASFRRPPRAIPMSGRSRPSRRQKSPRLQPIRLEYEGRATIETYTIIYRRDGTPEFGTVIARTPAGERLMARVAADDAATLGKLTDLDTQPIGAEGHVEPTADGLLRWQSIRSGVLNPESSHSKA